MSAPAPRGGLWEGPGTWLLLPPHCTVAQPSKSAVALPDLWSPWSVFPPPWGSEEMGGSTLQPLGSGAVNQLLEVGSVLKKPSVSVTAPRHEFFVQNSYFP